MYVLCSLGIQYLGHLFIMRFKRSYFLIFPLLIPNISVNVMFAVNFVFLSVSKRLKNTKINKYLTLLILCLLIYGIITFFITNELSILRVLALIFFIPILYQINEQHFSSIVWFSTIFIIFMIIFEYLVPNSPFRLFYRSSLAQYHIARESGLFLYPGDLGHFGVVVIAWCLRPKQLEVQKYRSLLFLFGLFIVLTSESRLALLQLISFLIFYLGFKRIHLFILFTLLLVFVIYVFGLIYFHSILTIVTDTDFLIRLKRIQEWIFLYESASLFGQKVESSDHSFFESSIVGIALRFGLLGSVGILLILYWSTKSTLSTGHTFSQF